VLYPIVEAASYIEILILKYQLHDVVYQWPIINPLKMKFMCFL